MTDTNQSVVWQGEYEPFGRAAETVALVEQNLRFPGQYHDRESGLHNNYFRTYDPQIGRYTQSDPIGLGGGINTYGYAYQNPLIYTDPTGQFAPAVWYAATALWAAFEFAGSTYDLYNTASTFADECSSGAEKVIAGVGFAAGVFLPGRNHASIVGKVTKGADSTLSRSGAFKEAKQKAGVPRSQHPDKVYREKIRDQQGHVEGRVYEFKWQDGSTATIREHSPGHKLDNHGPHFNSEVRDANGIKQSLRGNGDSHTYFRR